MLDILLSGRPVHHWQKMNPTKRLNTQLPRDFWSHIRVVRIHYPGQPSWQYLKTHVVRVVCAKCLFACYPITMFHLVWEAHLNLFTFSIPSYSHELDQLNLIFKKKTSIFLVISLVIGSYPLSKLRLLDSISLPDRNLLILDPYTLDLSKTYQYLQLIGSYVYDMVWL